MQTKDAERVAHYVVKHPRRDILVLFYRLRHGHATWQSQISALDGLNKLGQPLWMQHPSYPCTGNTHIGIERSPNSVLQLGRIQFVNPKQTSIVGRAVLVRNKFIPFQRIRVLNRGPFCAQTVALLRSWHSSHTLYKIAFQSC